MHLLWLLPFMRSMERFHMLLPRSEPCKMAERHTWIRVGRNRQGHLLAGHSGGHRVRSAQRHGVLTTREETMTGTWHWPKLNSRRAIGLRPRTTTSTPNTISDRYPRTHERHTRFCYYNGRPWSEEEPEEIEKRREQMRKDDW